ncbi:hypothetical protein [Labrys neptuniae]
MFEFFFGYYRAAALLQADFAILFGILAFALAYNWQVLMPSWFGLALMPLAVAVMLATFWIAARLDLAPALGAMAATTSAGETPVMAALKSMHQTVLIVLLFPQFVLGAAWGSVVRTGTLMGARHLPIPARILLHVGGFTVFLVAVAAAVMSTKS